MAIISVRKIIFTHEIWGKLPEMYHNLNLWDNYVQKAKALEWLANPNDQNLKSLCSYTKQFALCKVK